MADDCTGGQNASLNVNNNDCSCVSIASIVWNLAGTQFTITLNNGQSITSPVLTGATGPAPTISFRVSGTTLQYSINGGTSWVSIYNLSQLTDGVLHNDTTSSTTVTNAQEVLKTYTLPAGKLATNGDMIYVRARLRANNDAFFKQGWIYIDGVPTANTGLVDYGGTLMVLETYITRTAATTGIADNETWGWPGGTIIANLTQNVSVSDWADALDIEIRADDKGGNAITCDLFQVTYIKKI